MLLLRNKGIFKAKNKKISFLQNPKVTYFLINFRMYIIPKLIDRMTLNLFSIDKIVSKIDIWNQNWKLELETLKFVHFSMR